MHVVVVKVLGLFTETSSVASHDSITNGDLYLSSSQFSSVTATASTPGISCSVIVCV